MIQGKIKIFDIEADGLAEVNKDSKGKYSTEVSNIWCICVKDYRGEEVRTYGPDDILSGIEDLLDADWIVGHNIIDYDWRVLERLHGPLIYPPKLLDTLILSRVLYPDPKSHPFGGNSLEKWGVHLGFGKIEFNDFTKYSEEMARYCEQDVRLTEKVLDSVFRYFDNDRLWSIAEVEHSFAFEMARQCERGVAFDLDKARAVLNEFMERRDETVEQLREMFPPRVELMKTPAYYIDNTGNKWETIGLATASGVRRRDLTAGPCKKKVHPFNPDSRDECAARLREEYGWEPSVWTEGGKPKMSEDILSELPYPPAKMMSEYLVLGKRASQLSDLIKRAEISRDGRIHGTVNHYGAKTGRCSHTQPNLAQVPRVNKPFGDKFRPLFCAAEGRLLVGADAKGLELRMLAERMAKYDGGEYIDIVCDNDPHYLNQQAAGLSTRDQAKTLIYAINYGAGDAKVGSIVGGGQRAGQKIKSELFSRFPAIRYVMEEVQTEARTRGKVRLIDGRDVPVRSEHAALNDALQGDGAVLMKHALLIAVRRIQRLGLTARPVLNIHDEFQFEALAHEAEEVSHILEQSFTEAGKSLKFTCPIEGEAKVGKTWAETH